MTVEWILTAIVAAPGALFAALSLAWLLGWTPGEKLIARLTAFVYSISSACALWLGWEMWKTANPMIKTSAIHWFHVGEYHFELSLVSDKLSWPLITLTCFLVGLVGVFSVRYLHRDRGFFRFFLLLHLFAFGALLVLSAGTLDLLLAGWEMVGASSVLLVGFFDQRPEPVRNAVRVFAFYRIADLGLLLGLFFLHTFAHTTSIAELFEGAWPNQTTTLNAGDATLVGILLLIAAAGKSAQAPFSGWLPRAMEGPTPSSAIFYGSISVHLGAYLLLRAEPMLQTSHWAAGTVVVVGAVTALFATLIHRASTDAKTSLAYAGMAQVGIVFVEIGLGYPQLALTHMMGHAVVRTLQFLRAPSMLHDYHRVHAAAGGNLDRTGEHYERILPESARLWLYRAAVDRGYYDALLDRAVTSPFLRFARWCESLEPGAAQHSSESPEHALMKAENRLAERMES